MYPLYGDARHSYGDTLRGTAYSSKTVAFLLNLVGFLGVAGLHRFYVGKHFTGLLWLLTVGLFGVGTVVDLLFIGSDRFRDARGQLLR